MAEEKIYAERLLRPWELENTIDKDTPIRLRFPVIGSKLVPSSLYNIKIGKTDASAVDFGQYHETIDADITDARQTGPGVIEGTATLDSVVQYNAADPPYLKVDYEVESLTPSIQKNAGKPLAPFPGVPRLDPQMIQYGIEEAKKEEARKAAEDAKKAKELDDLISGRTKYSNPQHQFVNVNGPAGSTSDLKSTSNIKPVMLSTAKPNIPVTRMILGSPLTLLQSQWDEIDEMFRQSQENPDVLESDMYGTGVIGPKNIVEANIEEQKRQYQYQVGENITNGPFGAAGYLWWGDKGSFVGANLDQLSMGAVSLPEVKPLELRLNTNPEVQQTEQPLGRVQETKTSEQTFKINYIPKAINDVEEQKAILGDKYIEGAGISNGNQWEIKLIEMWRADGWDVTEQVYFKDPVSGKKAIVDGVAYKAGKFVFLDAKFGKEAKLSDQQKTVYPKIVSGEAIATDKRATELFGKGLHYPHQEVLINAVPK